MPHDHRARATHYRRCIRLYQRIAGCFSFHVLALLYGVRRTQSLSVGVHQLVPHGVDIGEGGIKTRGRSERCRTRVGGLDRPSLSHPRLTEPPGLAGGTRKRRTSGRRVRGAGPHQRDARLGRDLVRPCSARLLNPNLPQHCANPSTSSVQQFERRQRMYECPNNHVRERRSIRCGSHLRSIGYNDGAKRCQVALNMLPFVNGFPGSSERIDVAAGW